MATARAHWGSRFGFILAAAGSAVGLGNIWGFPYMTGQNGGGLFVLVYLVCVAVIGLPIMMAEIFIGRTTQRSPVGAYREMSAPGSPWLSLGWLSVVAAFVILSFYSVIAGWSLSYVTVALSEGFAGKTPDEINPMFGDLAGSGTRSTMWHVLFMAITVVVVAGGVKGGIELCSKILMPTLFLLLIIILIWATTTDGFVPGIKYVIGIHDEDVLSRIGDQDPGAFTASSWLAALGQAFFSLSLGMGALITYGSYLRRNEDIVSTSIIVSVLDTSVALLSALIMFPILFAAGQAPNQGPGLVFTTLPLAFAEMPGGRVLAPMFFLLLAFAALTSAISLLEVATSYFIDERKWTRTKAALVTGVAVVLLGIPSAMSNMEDGFFNVTVSRLTGMSWFDSLAYATFNLMLPLGGLGIALFVAWRVGSQAREQGFKAGTRLGRMYWGWVLFLRFLVPIAVLAVLLNAIGVI